MPMRFRLDSVWKNTIRDLGIPKDVVLRRAGLPLNLLTSSDVLVNVDEYFRLIDAIDTEADNTNLGVEIGQTLPAESFDPMLFAAVCSPNLETAVQRVSKYRGLVGPLRIDMEWVPAGLKIEFHCAEQRRIPQLLGMVETTFALHWIRDSTRTPIVPMRLGMPALPADNSPLLAYFGISPSLDKTHSLLFSYNDAQRPFFNANRSIWDTFEPALRRRLWELEGNTPFHECVEVALLELLPSGRANKHDVAQSLGVGERTLQRRLKSEGASFQEILAMTREALARHYLTHTKLTSIEIAYLLDFDEPKSLYRAFHQWTGTTPEAMRRAASP